MARRRRRAQPERVNIEYRDLNDIIPYDNNPRDNAEAVESVANSIRNFGFLVPIVVDEESIVIAGHTRLEAAKRLGLSDAPVIVATALTDAQVQQFRLIDNKVSELAKWDYDMLAGEITALQDSGINFTDFGWNQEEIDCLTEVVADDCLAIGSVVDDDELANRRRASQPRGPSTTRFVFGEIVFFVPAEAYRQWANGIRSEFDYQEDDIIAEIKRRLGLPVGTDI